MSRSPVFESLADYRRRVADIDFWWPYITEALTRHNLLHTHLEPIAGFNPTNPTFVCGDVVVKFFGYGPWADKGFRCERAAHRVLATDPEIAAPKIVAGGQLVEHPTTPWFYLITTRVAGVPWHEARLTLEQRYGLAAEVGKQVRRLHARPPFGIATHDDWPAINVRAAAAHSSLPPHLVAQVDDYLAEIGEPDPVMVHGDLVAMHVFVDDGEFAGIIDWGDAMVTDRHYEIIQIFRDLFECDADLLRVFLEASNWPMDSDFPRKAMGQALYRQAIGMTQHHSIDVFEPVAARYPLHDIATLDELARTLFDI